MPIYEYFCDDCKIKFEEIVSPSGPTPLPECPECLGHDVQRVQISGGTGFRLEPGGVGWEADGYGGAEK